MINIKIKSTKDELLEMLEKIKFEFYDESYSSYEDCLSTKCQKRSNQSQISDDFYITFFKEVSDTKGFLTSSIKHRNMFNPLFLFVRKVHVDTESLTIKIGSSNPFNDAHSTIWMLKGLKHKIELFEKIVPIVFSAMGVVATLLVGYFQLLQR